MAVRRRILPLAPAGAVDIVSGDLAVTEAIDTAAFTGGPVIAAALAVTEAIDTASFAGSVVVSGALAVTEAVDVAVFAGSVVVSGALAVTEAVDTAVVTGSVVVSGTLAVTEALDTAVFTGSGVAAAISGTLAVTEALDTSAFVGSVVISGTLGAIETVDSATFTGDTAVALGVVYLDPTLLGTDIVLSNANLTATQTAATTGNARANAHHSAGKYYYEFTVNVTGNMQVGLCNATTPVTEYLGQDITHSAGVDDTSGWLGAGGTTTAPALINGHVYGMAIDIDAKKAWCKDITAGGNWNANASANPVTGTNGATLFVTTITIDDGAIYPNERYQSGSYLAFQAVNDTVSTSSQNMVITPAAFPSGVTFNWVWPDAADTSIKSWNAVDFGNYLNTEVPVPITPGKISALDTLKVRTVWTWSMAADSANITMDFFLYNSASSTAGAMLAEFQIFYHTPDSTKTFVDSVTSLGTYTSASIDGTPSIAWHVGRQTANFFGTPYYLFYPVDQSDKLDMTFDAKAALNWLMAPNPTTSVTYFTGDEYFNGLGTGVEPMRKTGTATLGTYLVTYATTAPPPIPPDLPPNTNLIPLAARTDFTNAFWTAQGSTKQTGGYTEDASSGVHGIFGGPVSVAASTIYTGFIDVDVSVGQPWMFFQIQSSDFGSDAQGYFNIANLSVSSGAASGAFTAFSSNIALLTTGKTRIYMTFTTGPATTAVYFTLRSATGAFGTSYAGSTSKSVAFANPFLYT